MHEHSRDLYRAVRPLLRTDVDPEATRHAVRCCEAAVQAVLAGQSLGQRTQVLFAELRSLAPPSRQLALVTVIERRLLALRRGAVATTTTAARDGRGVRRIAQAISPEAHGRDVYRSARPSLRADLDPVAARHAVRSCQVAAREVMRGGSLDRQLQWLFGELRSLAGPAAQLSLLDALERALHAARRAAIAAGPERVGACAARNRRGEPCGRMPGPGSEFCPWHRPADAPAPP